ncbi:PKD domain-containing protein [Gaoshiqia sp. Z1-71]|uniref:PKD domain-containing protein n=1 Tax=Gaoshiqia hydrogeniformans TaxID=3290090 RepID=UPI003BF84B31
MKKLIHALLLIFNVTLVTGQTDFCRKSTEGINFWFGFMESRNYNVKHVIEITVTARETTDFQIFIGRDEVPFNGVYTVQANNSLRIEIPWGMVEAIGSEQIENKGIRLVSEKPVNLYALNWDINSSDVAVIYPVESLGKEYFAMCYEPHIHENGGNYGNGRNSQFLIVACEDQTQVSIVPSKITHKLANAGDTMKVMLSKGEIFQVQSMNRVNLTGQGDLTGSYILANKPVAFYSGALATTVPVKPGVSAWDHLYEQIPPVYSWGREYYAVPLKSREQDVYRIMAARDGTTVYIDGFPPILLNRGEFEEIVLFYNQPRRIYAEKPILVAQYSQSQSVDFNFTGGNGDPFMTILSSTNQAKNDVTFVAYDSDQIKKYFVNIITLTGETGNILLDGTSVQSSFTPFSDGKYSWAQLDINPGTYRLQNTNQNRGFLAYVYGFGGVESYGYGVGFNLDLVLDLGESVDFHGDTLLLCYGESRTLDAGPYFDTYRWNTGDSTQTLTVTTGGKYAVKTTTIDGCELEDSIIVYVSHPVVNLGIDEDAGCFPYSVTLDGNKGFKKYLWQNEFGDTLSSSQTFDADYTGEFRITVSDKYNCVARDTMRLVVYPVPTVKIAGEQLLCGEQNSQLTVSVEGAAESLWNYEGSFSWSANKPALLTFSEEQLTSVKLTASEWGTYEIYYRLKTIDGCEVADTFQVRFHQQPTSHFNFEDDAVCEGYSKKLLFTGAATDSASFYWDLDGCIFTDTLAWDQYRVSVGAFLSKPPYISLFIDDHGCRSDTTIQPLGAKPNFIMQADQLRGCDTLTVNFSAILLTDDFVNFQWKFDDGEIINRQHATKTYESPGFYPVSLTITNPVTRCQNGFTLDSMIRVFPTPRASIVADPGICYDDSARVFYANATDSSVYYWEFDGARQVGGKDDAVTVLLDEPMATVRLRVEEYGCISQPAEIGIKRKPRFDFFAENEQGCQPYAVEIFADAKDSDLSFLWVTDHATDLTGESLFLNLPDPGKYDLALIGLSSATGCSDTLYKSGWLWVHPKPRADFDVNFPIATIENADILFYNHSQNGDYYSWDFGDGSLSADPNPAHTYAELGDYYSQLVAESVFGCKDTANLLIKIIPFNVYSPNAFRPDSDIPENRTFMPVGLGADNSRFNLRIYDRWGQIVFETGTPDNPWDGTNKNGKPAPMGNYVWMATFHDIQGYEHKQKGQILLIR